MKKSDFSGWQNVFLFSLVQSLKQKSFVIYLVVLSLICLASQPFMRYRMQSSAEKEANKETKIQQVMLCDLSGLSMDYQNLQLEAPFDEVEFVTIDQSTYDQEKKKLEDSKDSQYILGKISLEDNGDFKVYFVRATQGEVTKKDTEKFADCFKEAFQEGKIEALNISEDQLAWIQQDISTEVAFTAEDGSVSAKPKYDMLSMVEYGVMLTIMVLVLFLVSFTGGSIATSIVTEKSTRVVEYMMINVRAMALIVGKLLSCLTLVVIQFVLGGICFVVSSVISLVVFGVNDIASGIQSGMEGIDTEMVQETSEDIIASLASFDFHINPLHIAILVIVVLVGVLFYCILAGLCGASVSKMEELSDGLKIYQLSMIAGSYIGIFSCMFQSFGVVPPFVLYIFAILPISSPFVLPANLIAGKIGTGVGVVGMLVLIATTAFLFKFTANVYEALIFYNGKALKFKDIMSIAKNRKGAKKEVEVHE